VSLRRLVVAALVLLASAGQATAAALVDPALRFRQIRTEHFIIYFHEGEERLAQRLAVVAEETRERLATFLSVPTARTHVILVDQSEIANGWATPLPFNTITLHAAWPSGGDLTGHTDDWLRMVFAHEFTHIAHLDRSREWAHAARVVFGRLPLAFPNMFLPYWQIEGLATLAESRLTGRGRVYSANFAAMLNETAYADALEPMDRLNGGLTDWPSGQGPYAYGVNFHTYLARRFGDDRFDDLADVSARMLPFAGAFAFREAFGVELSALWKDYQAELRSAAGNDDDGPTGPGPLGEQAERLTTHGFATNGPRFLPVCDSCDPELAYSSLTPHEFPSIEILNMEAGTSRSVASRYLGSALGVAGDWLVFDQLDLHRNTGLYGDLYAVDRTSGRVQALTSEARLLDPDVGPDGRAIVAVRQEPGYRSLVTFRLSGVAPDEEMHLTEERTLFDLPDTQWNLPRWSPDGTSLVVGRHRLGSLPEIVIVRPAEGTVQVIAAATSHRIVTPTWRPDGQAIVAAADFDGVFNLYEFPIDGSRPRQLTSVRSGATSPDVSPDGRTIAFVGYTTDGFDVFTMPYPANPRPVTNPSPASEPPAANESAEPDDEPLGEEYSPWSTIWPRYWAPIVTLDGDQVRAGGSTSGHDVLRYHGFNASITWLIDVEGRNPRPVPSATDWNVTYAYSRWTPTFYASTSRETTLLNGPLDVFDIPRRGSVQDLVVEGGMVLPTQTIRTARQWQFAVRRESFTFALDDERAKGTEMAYRAAWSIRNAREYGYSISPDDGGALGLTLDWRPDVDGSAVTTLGADARVYLPGLRPHHVAAIRGGLAASHGPLELRRAFLLGGSQASGSVTSFDRDAFGLLRGFENNRHAASRVTAFNADYRLPLARPQRGIRTIPVMLHSMHAAVFLDVARAWDTEDAEAATHRSIGAEFSFDLVAGYQYQFTIALGAALIRDAVARQEDGAAFFARIGRSF